MDGGRVVVDLGCGNKKHPNAIGVDLNSRVNPDVVHNLNEFPYPFEDESIDMIYIDNTLEHLDDPLRVMEEIYRIVKIGGIVKVIVPYFRSVSAFIDPTHKHFFTVESFCYYDPGHVICQRYDYTLARFKANKIVFHEGHTNGLIKKALVYIANNWPLGYERYLSMFIPLDEITYYLRKL